MDASQKPGAASKERRVVSREVREELMASQEKRRSSTQGRSGGDNVAGSPTATDLQTLQNQFRSAQVELARERNSRKLENTRASAQIANLEKAVSEGRALMAGRSRLSIAVTILLVIAAGICFFLGRDVFRSPVPGPPSVPPPGALRPEPTPEKSAREEPAPEKSTPDGAYSGIRLAPEPLTAPTLSQLPSKSSSPFSAAVSRLDRALNSFPGSPEFILRTVHSASGPSVCNFEWTNGQPAIILHGEGRDLSLSRTLNNCAEALENFHKKAANDLKLPL